MAVHNKTAENDMLLDVELADMSSLHRFYLKQEKKILGGLSIIVFLFLWEFIGGTLSVYDPIPALRINPLFVSSPSLVWKAAVELSGTAEFWNDLRVSGIEFFWGYILSVIVAIPFGILTGWYKRWLIFLILLSTP